MNDLPDVLNRLEARVETLEQRVYALEHPTGTTPEIAAQELISAAAASQAKEPSLSMTSGLFPLLGKAMLGIAGAYLLRALAESNSLPKVAVAAVAIAYALGWLVWASRAKAGDWIAGTTYACTSALILAPMLSELTLRFQVLPAWVTASVVCGFVVAASALAWKRDFAPVLWVANGTAVATSLALALASHQMTPFIVVLLLMVLIGEYAAVRDRDSGVRVLVTLAADAAVWTEIYVYSGPKSARVSYPALGPMTLLAPGVGLFLILGASLIYRVVPHRKAITVFETIETMIAFLLAACSLVYFGPPSSTMMLGVSCLVLSAAGYVGAIAHFNCVEERRNSLVFASWSGALLVAGSLFCLPQGWQVVWLSVAAVAATLAGARLGRLALELHGMVLVMAAAWISGLGTEISNALAGALPATPGLFVCIASTGAILCYAVIKPCDEKTWTLRVPPLVFAALATGVAAAFTVHGLAGLMELKALPEAHHVAFIRTLTLCLVAIALAYSGAHWRRMELTRIGYATLVALALKLFFEDLRHGHMAFIAASIFLFAMTLIAVPRVARTGQLV